MTNARRPAPLNIAAMIPALPEVICPNGAAVQLAPLTADAYQKFLQIQSDMRDGLDDGADSVDETAFVAMVDDVLRAVLPGASGDAVASFGARLDAKLTVIFTAAGAVDDTLRRLSDAAPVPEGNGKASPRSRRETRSVAPARGTPKRSRKTG